MILVLDTAKEEVFIGLWDSIGSSWEHQEFFIGGRDLNKLIIEKLKLKDITFIDGIIVNAGPGSFTGLRIGMSVANTIAYSKNVPIVAPVESKDIENLLQKGLTMLKSAGSQFSSAAIPNYGAEPHITKPKC